MSDIDQSGTATLTTEESAPHPAVQSLVGSHGPDDARPLGRVLLPGGHGTGVGRFSFVADRHAGRDIEIGWLVTADTAEGPVVGMVTDMRTVGTDDNPIRADLGGSLTGRPTGALSDDVVVADVEVLHSDLMRPVRPGRVRAATRDEVGLATKLASNSWPIPSGIVELHDPDSRGFAPVHFDGTQLLGPDSAHLTVSGLSGVASKSSYTGVLLRSALHHHHDRRVAGLVLNVKGEDTLWLDKAPREGYALTEDDHAMYEALGTPATPFPHVTVYAPALKHSAGTTSARDDALPMQWGLIDIWPYMRFIVPDLYSEEKFGTAGALLADLGEYKIHTSRPHDKADTFDSLLGWMHSQMEDQEGDTVWRGHHRATFGMVRRRIAGVVSRMGGLVTTGKSTPARDVPADAFASGELVVVDIAGLTPDVQAVVVARTLDRIMTAADGDIGVDHLIVWADELNAWAPSTGRENFQVRRQLEILATQGRYKGLSVWGMAQSLSKVSELVTSNAPSRAVGMTAPAELASSTYGRIADGLAQRIQTLPRGQMVLWHYCYATPMLVRFPRPAWATGKAKVNGAGRPRSSATPARREVASLTSDGAALSAGAIQRLTAGRSEAEIARIVAESATSDEAVARLAESRDPDMRVQAPSVPPTIDPTDPFAVALAEAAEALEG